MTKQRKLETLIDQVRAVALEIGFKPPVKGERNMLRILAATLDYRGIRPLKTTSNAKIAWLTTNNYDQIKTDRLLRVLKEHLPEFLTQDSPVLSNPVSKMVSKTELAKPVSKSEPVTHQTPDSAGPNLNGWTIRKDKHGYYRAYRKVEGKTRSVYLGKELDDAEEKLGQGSSGDTR